MNAALEQVIAFGKPANHGAIAGWDDGCGRAFGRLDQTFVKRRDHAATELSDLREGMRPAAVVGHTNGLIRFYFRERRLESPPGVTHHGSTQHRGQKCIEFGDRDIASLKCAASGWRPPRVAGITAVENRNP